MHDYKSNIKKAIDKYLQKQLQQDTPGLRKKNSDPENQVIKNELIPWCLAQGIIIYRYESKAVKNYKTNKFLSGNVIKGHSDLAGFTKNGVAVYIEAKAPGKRSTVSYEQREFLRVAIGAGCFAVVSDSLLHLRKIYQLWTASNYNKEILLMDLPKKSELRSNDILFE